MSDRGIPAKCSAGSVWLIYLGRVGVVDVQAAKRFLLSGKIPLPFLAVQIRAKRPPAHRPLPARLLVRSPCCRPTDGRARGRRRSAPRVPRCALAPRQSRTAHARGGPPRDEPAGPGPTYRAEHGSRRDSNPPPLVRIRVGCFLVVVVECANTAPF